MVQSLNNRFIHFFIRLVNKNFLHIIQMHSTFIQAIFHRRRHMLHHCFRSCSHRLSRETEMLAGAALNTASSARMLVTSFVRIREQRRRPTSARHIAARRNGDQERRRDGHLAADCAIVRHGSPELVALAEAKLAGERVTIDQVRAAAQPLFDAPGAADMDSVVLACTHFPLLAEELAAAFPGIRWVDGGAGIARRIAWLTRDQPWPQEPSDGIAIFTGDAPRTALLSSLAAFGLGEVRQF